MRDELMLSVVIVVGNRRDRFAGCLRSVLAQELPRAIEVLVLDVGDEGAAPLFGVDDPAVRVVRLPRRGSFGDLRAEGVRLARAPLVAFLEEHVRVRPGWAKAILAADDGSWAGICGEVYNANPGIGISDIVWLMNYTGFLPPASSGTRTALPGHNSAYRREVLLSLGPEQGTLLQSEILLQWELIRRGHLLLLKPEAGFAHINEHSLASIVRGYYLWNRSFGAARARIYRWSMLHKAARLLSAPLVPWVRLMKLLVSVRRGRPDLLGAAVRGAPIILIAQIVATAGLITGMLFGPGDAAERFRDYELTAFRKYAGSGHE